MLLLPPPPRMRRRRRRGTSSGRCWRWPKMQPPPLQTDSGTPSTAPYGRSRRQYSRTASSRPTTAAQTVSFRSPNHHSLFRFLADSRPNLPYINMINATVLTFFSQTPRPAAAAGDRRRATTSCPWKEHRRGSNCCCCKKVKIRDFPPPPPPPPSHRPPLPTS